MEHSFNLKLKKRIMRRVYARWFAKKAWPILFIELPLLIIFVAKIRELVFWTRVVDNAAFAASGATKFLNFAMSAVLNAEISVYAVMLGITLVFAFLIRDFMRTTRQAVELLLSRD